MRKQISLVKIPKGSESISWVPGEATMSRSAIGY